MKTIEEICVKSLQELKPELQSQKKDSLLTIELIDNDSPLDSFELINLLLSIEDKARMTGCSINLFNNLELDKFQQFCLADIVKFLETEIRNEPKNSIDRL